MKPQDIDETLFQKYDGKSVAPFKRVAVRWDPTPSSMRQLIRLVASPDERVQVGATWVLKRWIETDSGDPGPVTPMLLDLVEVEMATDAKLHLLQLLQHLEIPRDREHDLYSACSQLLDHPNKFLRAWAFNGLGLVAIQNRDYRPRVEGLFAEAESTQPSSVMSRIRNLRKQL